jgi:hypothetical protein
MSEMKGLGRIAFRHEGEMWNAYYAEPGTMEGALLLGSIRFVTIASDPEAKEAFMALMQAVVNLALKQMTGRLPTWDAPSPAPESERSGHA